MDANLHDYAEQNPPEIQLSKPITHPTNRTSVIGHVGLDKGRDVGVATLPRNREEHWFRGESTSGLTGYGISEAVLDRLDHPGMKPIRRVLIIETDTNQIIEYERSEFEKGVLVAYSPELDESVIGDEAMRVGEKFTDLQRVLPVEKARQTFERQNVTIHQ